MKLKKMYLKSKENIIGISFLGVLLFVCSFFIESKIFKIFSYILFVISIICLIYIFVKVLIINYEVKKNCTTIKEIPVNSIKNISSTQGYRQQFKKRYFGIKIVFKKDRYLYFYKNVLSGDSDFSLYNKIKNVKKIKIEVYRKSKIIKKIITKL